MKLDPNGLEAARTAWLERASDYTRLDESIAAAIAAYLSAASPAQAPAETNGWKIADQFWLDTFEKSRLAKMIDVALLAPPARLPDEPTEAMYKAAYPWFGSSEFNFREMYRAMRLTPPPASGAPADAGAVEGWQLVPIEPTQAMKLCARSNWSGFCSDKPGSVENAAGRLYRAMLAAAPRPAEGGPVK